MFSKKVWIAFIIIIIAYGFVLQQWEGIRYLYNVSRIVKHGTHFSFLLFFSAVGYWGWNSYREKWILYTWVLFHAGIIILICVSGIIDIFSTIENVRVRSFFIDISSFCTSPVPYGMCMLFVKLKTRMNRTFERKSI